MSRRPRCRPRPRRRGDDGFTLIELLVTMSIATIVLVAVLNSADIFATTAKSSGDASIAQNKARSSVRDAVAFLRQGRVATGQTTPIPAQWVPSRSDLTAAAYVAGAGDARPGEVAGWIRYCAQTVGTETSLVVGVRVGDAYAAPGACAAGDVTNGWSHTTAIARMVTAPTRLFNFTSTACSGATCLPAGPAVSVVGIRLSIASSPGSSRLGSTVTDAVSFRNRSS